MNFGILFAVALVPLLLGMIWYNEKVFGKAWMESSGIRCQRPSQEWEKC